MYRKLVLVTTFVLALTCILLLAFNIQRVKAEGIEIGEWISDGRIALCIHSFSTAPSIDYYPYKPKTPGYIFAWVDLSLKNVGTEEVSTNSLFAYLKDYENYMYKSVIVLSPKAFQLIDLPPGETLRGEIYWEMPSDTTIVAFIWYDYRSYVSIIIPEFSSFLIPSLFMIATLLAVIFYKRSVLSASSLSKSRSALGEGRIDKSKIRLATRTNILRQSKKRRCT